MFRVLKVAVLAVVMAGQAIAYPAVDAYVGLRPTKIDSEKTRCTDDGRDCIHLETYSSDVCKIIERNAHENDLDPNFLARLLWKESRFEPGAVSPAGALGIAQFMPGTADLYDLDDPFNPALAIRKSAWYLDRLRDMFGNIGLAAVAYNGGENRAARFISGQGGLPYETQDYVEAITGFDALRWRDNPPKDSELKLSLNSEDNFRAACEKLAGERSLREFIVQPRVFPWGVIVASHPSRSGAQQQVSRLNRSLSPILDGKRVGYVQKRLRGMPRAIYTAQVGYDSRREAAAFCLQFKRLGGRCLVLRN